MISNKKYVGSQGCPVCSELCIQYEAFFVDADETGTFAFQSATCPTCGTSWLDRYTFTGLSDVEDKDGNEIEVEDD